MKKENGFTLIEIIGAIVILGVIAIIAFSTYTSSLTNFRTNYYTKELKTIEKTAEEFFNDNRNYKPTKILNAQEVSLNTLETKDYIGKVVDYNGNSCSDSSYAMVVKEGLNDYSYHVCLICDKDGYDNTLEDPYCDRSWLDPTKVTYGIGEVEKKYVYKGASREELREELELPISYIRKDNNGNIIATRRGTKEGNETIFPVNMDIVNTEELGTYQVTYRYENEEKTGIVEVYENSAPSIIYKTDKTVATTLSGTTSTTNGNYVNGVWTQNVIVILSTNGYKEDGVGTSKFQWNVDGRWQDFCDSDPCEKKITRELNQTVQFRTVDTKGHISLITDEITMKIDNTKPRCSLSIPTTIGENGWYNQNVEVVFNEKIDQKVTDDTSLVSGIKNYNIQVSTENLARVATIGTKTQSADTANIKYIGYVEDEAGNFNTCEVTFKKDSTPPTCNFTLTGNKGDDNWYIENVRVVLSASDSLSKVDAYGAESLTGERDFYHTADTTEKKYTGYVKDKAGNTNTCTSSTFKKDSTPPTCGTWSGESINWTKDDRTIAITCSDATSTCIQNTYGTTISSGTTKTKELSFTLKDKAGNTKNCPKTANVYVDKTEPTCGDWSGEETTWINYDRTISIGCSDSGSGCVNASESTTISSGTTKTKSISLTIKDNVGNTKTCTKMANVYVDKTAPTCGDWSGEGTTWTKNDRTIKVGCSDADSGCVSTTYTKTFNTTTEKNDLTLTIKDAAGNEKTCSKKVNVYVDKTEPTCGDWSGEGTNWTNSDRTISVGCSDANSGCASATYTKTFNTTTRTNDLTLTIKDAAGNEKTCSKKVNVYVDKIEPTCGDWSGEGTTWINSDRTISVGCSDTNSGCVNASESTTISSGTTQTGSVSIKIKDSAGNEKTCSKIANIYVDKTGPTCGDWSGESATWTKNDRTISVVCSDSGIGCESATYSEAFNTTTTTNNLTLTIKDKLGNSTDCTKNVNVYVDKTEPTCGDWGGESTTWTNLDRTISVGCTDSNSGCASATYTKTFNTTTEKNDLTLTIKDAAGNEKTCTKTVNVYVDKTDPKCENSGDSATWTSSDRTIKYGCSDSDSGCNKDNQGGTRKFTSTTATATIDKYTIKDNAGNSKECAARTASVYVDKSSPTCSISKSNTGTVSGVTTTVTCSDTGSGVNDCPSGDTGLIESKTYTVTDNVGKTGTCSATVSAQGQKRTKSCTSGNRCEAAGCETYETCSNSACGVASYNRCSSAGCEAYNSCVSSSCTCKKWTANYRCTVSGRTSSGIAGTGTTKAFAENGCYSYSTSCCPAQSGGGCSGFSCSASCTEYDSCENSSCTCKRYNRSPKCGVESYNVCTTSGCGCKTNNASISDCGCSTWGDFGSWSNVTSCSAGTTNDTTTECRTLYS